MLNKTKEMERYERETGKQAIWQGEITKGFLKWKEGEDNINYYADKKRISVYISHETEKKWLDFVEHSEFSTLSKLIRKSVNTFIAENSNPLTALQSTYGKELSSAASYELKQRITTIKGFLQLIIEAHDKELNDQIKKNIKNALEQVNELENKFIMKTNEKKGNNSEYDVLLIEDDLATVELITNYFSSNGYSCKGVYTGRSGIEELKTFTPKLILIDIILPDISGFEICKKLKFTEEFKNTPIFYLTAIPGFKVQESMEDTKADGYLLKPFDLKDIESLFKYL